MSVRTLIWEPLVRVGPFLFNSRIDRYLERYKFLVSRVDVGNEEFWDCYELPDWGLDLCCSDSRIISISCERELVYRGQNLIGMNFSHLVTVLDVQPTEYGDDIAIGQGHQTPVEFDDLGLQAWVLGSRVVKAMTGPFIVDDGDAIM